MTGTEFKNRQFIGLNLKIMQIEKVQPNSRMQTLVAEHHYRRATPLSVKIR